MSPDTGYDVEEQDGRTYYRSKVKPSFVTPHLHLMQKHLELAGPAPAKPAAPPPPKPKKPPEEKPEENHEK